MKEMTFAEACDIAEFDEQKRGKSYRLYLKYGDEELVYNFIDLQLERLLENKEKTSDEKMALIKKAKDIIKEKIKSEIKDHQTSLEFDLNLNKLELLNDICATYLSKQGKKLGWTHRQDLWVSKFNGVQSLIDILNEMPEQKKKKEDMTPDEINDYVKKQREVLTDFQKQFDNVRPVIEERNDSLAMTVIKVIATILTLGIGAAAFGIWDVRGGKVAEGIDNNLKM